MPSQSYDFRPIINFLNYIYLFWIMCVFCWWASLKRQDSRSLQNAGNSTEDLFDVTVNWESYFPTSTSSSSSSFTSLNLDFLEM